MVPVSSPLSPTVSVFWSKFAEEPTLK